VIPEKGKGKSQGGQDTREGDSSHEKRAAKKRKTYLRAKFMFIMNRYCNPYIFWRISNMAVAARFI